MKILIKVTSKILRRTSNCSSDYGINCAIAEAVREILPYSVTNANHINVYSEPAFTHWVKYDLGSYDRPHESIAIAFIPLPEEAVNFVADFDIKLSAARVLMEPISFEIDIPMDLIEQIGISEAYKILSESKTLELVSIN